MPLVFWDPSYNGSENWARYNPFTTCLSVVVMASPCMLLREVALGMLHVKVAPVIPSSICWHSGSGSIVLHHLAQQTQVLSHTTTWCSGSGHDTLDLTLDHVATASFRHNS